MKRKAITTLLSLIAALALQPAAASATEVNNSEANTSDPPQMCRLTMRVTDKTGKAFDGDITVTLKQQFDGDEDNPNAKIYMYVLRKGGNDYGAAGIGGGIDCGEILAGSGYGVSLDYQNSGKYKITYSTGAEPRFCYATVNGLFLDFVVSFVPAVDEQNAGGATATGAASGSNGGGFGGENEHAEADALFQKLLESLEPGRLLAVKAEGIEEDAWKPSIEWQWKYFFDKQKSTADSLCLWYYKQGISVFDGTSEEWLELPALDAVLMFNTYSQFVGYAKSAAGIADYVKDEDSFLRVGTIRAGLMQLGDEDSAKAYKNVMLWQYNHYKETGSFYNFVTHKEWFESVVENASAQQEANGGAAVLPGQIGAAVSVNGRAKEEADEMDGLKQAFSELMSELNIDEAAEIKAAANGGSLSNASIAAEGDTQPIHRSVWSSVIGTLAKPASIIMIVVAVILIGVLYVVRFYRKRRDDDGDEI